MRNIRLVAGALLILIAATVAFFMLFDHFLNNLGVPYSAIWGLANPLMALGMVLALFAAVHAKRAAEAEAHSPAQRAEAGVALCITLFVALLFFSNWFAFLSLAPGESQSASRLTLWLFINAAFPLVCAYYGAKLLRSNIEA